MLSAMSRLKSNSWKEKMYGVIYYLLIASSAYMSYLLLFNDKDLSLSEVWYLIPTLFFTLTTSPAFSDYSNSKNLHRGSLEYFVSILNPARKTFMYYLDRGELNDSRRRFSILNLDFLPLSIIFSILFFVILTSPVLNFYKPLLWVIYTFSLLIISYEISRFFVNNDAVSENILVQYYDIESLTSYEKEQFKYNVISEIKRHGKITRIEAFKMCINELSRVKRRKKALALEAAEMKKDLKRKAKEERKENQANKNKKKFAHSYENFKSINPR